MAVVWDVACGVPLQVHSHIARMANLPTLPRAVAIIQFLGSELALAALCRTIELVWRL